MNGRVLFDKYGRIFDVLVKISKVYPRSIREKRFNNLCSKSGKITILRRYILLKSLCAECGENVAVFSGCYIFNFKNLRIGSNVSIHEMCYIDAEGGICIGNNVSIAHRSTVLSSNHSYKLSDVPIKYQDMILKHTIIEDNVWIGCGTTVLAGVRVGSGSVIGAGSVVTKEIEKNSVAVGCPAKIKFKR